MPRAFPYVRVSTDRQQLSPEVQKEQCRRYFDYRLAPQAVEWGGVYEDPAVSAKVPLAQRPAGSRLCLDLQAGDHVLVAKLDRAFRSTVDCLQTVQGWQEKGVTAHFLDVSVDTSTPMGKFFLTLVAAFAELERARISERTREALAARRRLGGAHTGVPPYGYKTAGVKGSGRRHLVRNPYQRQLGSKFLALFEEGWSRESIYWWARDNKVYYKGKVPKPSTIEAWIKAEAALRLKEQQEHQGSQGQV